MNQFRGKFNSLKDLYLGIKHLFPNSQIDYYLNDIYSNDENENVGYIGVELNGSYHIIQHVPSEYGDGNIGLVWVDQRRDKRFEFSSLEELNDLINEKIRVMKQFKKEGPFVSDNLSTLVEADYGTVGILEDNLPSYVEEDDVEEIWFDFLADYIDQSSDEYRQALTQYLNKNYPRK